MNVITTTEYFSVFIVRETLVLSRVGKQVVLYFLLSVSIPVVALADQPTRADVPLAHATSLPQLTRGARSPTAIPFGRRMPIPTAGQRRGLNATTTLFTQSFATSATTPNAWIHGDHACITAGNSTNPPTPASSIPACGPNAPQDLNGQGALELTPPVNYKDGYAVYGAPLATSSGLSISFTYFSFDTHGNVGDGLALVLTDASRPLPTTAGGCCGSLGYAASQGRAAFANGYLAVALDETGYFTQNSEGRTGGTAGLIPNIITARGAVTTGAQYLLSSRDATGRPAALPFALDNPGATLRPSGLGVNVTLSATGLLSVSIDRHDGNGSVVYLPPTPIVGLNGQPALPAHVFLGFTSAGGYANARHEIRDLAVATAWSAPPPIAKTSVLTYHNDNGRTGWNAAETVLTTANVNASTFGLLHTVAVDGRVDAQPLVVASEPIDNQGVHDVVYVATENDSVYAIDAQSGAILQTRNFGASIPNTAKDYDDNIFPVYGIASTPVIDPAMQAMYLVTETNEGISAPDVFRLHKVGLRNLSDLVPSIVLAPATNLRDGSVYRFPAQHERQRAALLDAGGVIYVAFGSTGDTHPALSRGIIAGFSAASLAPLASNVGTDRLATVTNPYYLTSIWQSGFGPAADPQGNIYFSTGNSDPNAPSYDPLYNFPDSVLKVAPDLARIVDSFTQYNYFGQDQGDGDLGSGGTMLVPEQFGGVFPHLAVAGGKDGKAYVLNGDALGGFHANGPNRDIVELPSGPCWCGPAYFVGADSMPRIVTGGGNGVTSWRVSDGSTFTIAREGQTSRSVTNGQPDGGGTIPTISSNGTVAQSAIVWFVQRPNETQTYTMNLRAFDAMNLSNALFAAPAGNWTNANSNADAVPTVANGRVYVGSYKQLRIFGLFGH